MSPSALPDDYPEFLRGLKQRIRQAQVKAALAVNRELVLLYWQIGRDILQRQAHQGWGAKVILQLSQDLKREFPEMRGFSRTNLLYMRSFAEAYPDLQIVQQLAGQIPWFHNCVLLDKVKAPEQRLWYIKQTIKHGWSRNVLVLQIESRLCDRQGAAPTNFAKTLPHPQSDLAQQLLKDPYTFDFLSISAEAKERDIERSLVAHIQEFLLELGAGFAFVGRQFPLEIGGEDYRIDLLFYHVKLHCYVIIELKAGKFQPEYAGKLNFYINAVDDLLRTPEDNPTIGLILCKEKNSSTAEYALRNISTPMGIATHQLPQPLQENLPSIAQLEAELAKV
ncbi:MAG: PDDEXK nuclease domain-containing protein, partial [Cyanobacteria bacterium J06639_1]